MAWVERREPTRGKQHWHGFVQSLPPSFAAESGSPDEYQIDARFTLLTVAALATSASCFAAEKFTFLTNWYAQAEHGGFYQAQATGLYQHAGLDVEIKMGGPQINVMQLMAAGQADCTLGDNGQALETGRPGCTR